MAAGFKSFQPYGALTGVGQIEINAPINIVVIIIIIIMIMIIIVINIIIIMFVQYSSDIIFNFFERDTNIFYKLNFVDEKHTFVFNFKLFDGMNEWMAF